jgi:FMN-dependent NADH-azoreductase
MQLLHLDSSILGDGSASRTVSAAVVERLRAVHPEITVTYRDLAADPIDHLTLEAFGALDRGADVQQFLDADIVVIGAGFYNFSIPTQLKAWIDRIAVKGRTFAYGENGPVGLAKGKRVIIALARGGIYGEGSPFAGFEHGETLLRTVFGFMGVTDPEFIVAEGIGRGEEARATAIAAALATAGAIEPAELAA